MTTINLKGVLGDDIIVQVNSEDTNYCSIKFEDSEGNGLKSSDQLPDLVSRMNWSYATENDLKLAETLYNTEISKKYLWEYKNNK